MLDPKLTSDSEQSFLWEAQSALDAIDAATNQNETAPTFDEGEE